MNIGNKLSAVKTVVTSKAGRSLLTGQKHSPAILFGAGVIGVVATTILASKATLSLETIISDNEQKQGQAHDLHELNKLGKNNYNERDYKKDVAILKVRFVKDVTRLYAPAIIVGVASVGALTGSHIVLNRRYTGVVAAYATLDKSFKEYQERVQELAPDLDQKSLLNGVTTREIASDDGSKVSFVNESEGRSPYAKLFANETTQEWDTRADYNLYYLRCQQQYANDLLNSRGHVFLNEVYQSLGFEHTPQGAVTGWVKNNKRGGDNMVDFGIFESPDRFNDFMSGREGSIWLDFNVDGVVYDLI